MAISYTEKQYSGAGRVYLHKLIRPAANRKPWVAHLPARGSGRVWSSNTSRQRAKKDKESEFEWRDSKDCGTILPDCSGPLTPLAVFLLKLIPDAKRAPGIADLSADNAWQRRSRWLNQFALTNC